VHCLATVSLLAARRCPLPLVQRQRSPPQQQLKAFEQLKVAQASLSGSY